MKKSILFLLALFSVTMTTQAVDYYYKGNQTGWSATAPMSVSSDGYYAYAEAKSYADNGNQNNHFKIALAADSWDYGADYLHGGFNGTDIENMGSWDSDGNCCIYHETSYYVLAYFPNTKINTTNKVKICASTFLPDDSETDLPEPEPVADVTVHFINTPNWAAVACHHWVEGGSGTSWPGDVLSKTDVIAGYDVYTATFTGEHTSCIFNNNNKGSQTGNLTVEDGKYYALSTDTWYDDKAAAETGLAAPIPDETIYFINNKDWTTINIYAWGGSNSDLNTWPGKPNMTKETEQIAGFDVYSLTAQKGSYKNFIINNGSSQSADFTWSDDKYYWIEGTATGDTKANAEAALATPVVDVYTVVGSPALCGSNWDVTDTSNDMTLVDGLYVWTKENVTLTGNTTFKIVKNHDYGQGEWPSGYGANATIDISTSDCTEGGTYSIKITFDPTTGTITPTIESCEAAEEPIVHTYTVVGQAVLCESDWNISDATNDMTLTDGIYVWTNENVELRSNAEFRIVKDHAYDEAYPDGNYVIDLANYEGAAVYTVTITFNAETKEITVAMEKTGDVEISSDTYTIAGTPASVFGEQWNATYTANDMTLQEDGTFVWTATGLELSTTTEVSFKVVKNHAWNAEDGGGAWPASNYVITIPADGSYNLTIYFNAAEIGQENNGIYVNLTPISYTRNVTNTYGTICLPYASASTSGATFFEVVGQEAGKVYLASVTKLEAGVPYIFEKSASQIKVVYTGEKETTAGSANGLVGTFADNTTVPNDAYILYGGAFCTNNDPTKPNKINAYRAYLDLSAVTGGAPQQMPGRRYIGMDVQGEDEATGLDQIVVPEGQAIKAIVNGQLIIIRDGVKYNVQGQVIR